MADETPLPTAPLTAADLNPGALAFVPVFIPCSVQVKEVQCMKVLAAPLHRRVPRRVLARHAAAG